MKNKKFYLKAGVCILGAGASIGLINLPLFITEKKIVLDNIKSENTTLIESKQKSRQDLENKIEETNKSMKLKTAKIQSLEDKNKTAKETISNLQKIIRKNEKLLSNLKPQAKAFQKLKKYKSGLENIYEIKKAIYESSGSKSDYLEYLKVWKELATRKLAKKDIDKKANYEGELKWLQKQIPFIEKSLKMGV